MLEPGAELRVHHHHAKPPTLASLDRSEAIVGLGHTIPCRGAGGASAERRDGRRESENESAALRMWHDFVSACVQGDETKPSS